MKTKIFILAAILAAAIGTQAQYSDYYYHNTGDTVYNKSVIGFYNWWEWEQLIQDRDIFGPNREVTSTVNLVPFFTPAPLNIVGIAGCPILYRYGVLVDTIPTLVNEYFYLFEADGDDIVYKDKLAWDLRDPHRTLVLPYNHPYGHNADSCCGSYFNTFAFPLYEYYFDSTITVTDSFYVGFSNRTSKNNSIENEVRYWTMGQALLYSVDSCDELDHHVDFMVFISNSCGAVPHFRIKMCDDTNCYNNPEGDYLWEETLMSELYLVYPLIQIDTTVPPSFLCDPVQNFSATVLDTGSGCVFFTWDDFYHYTYCEVQYYAFEQGYNSAVTATVTGNNLLHLCDLDTTLRYFARIRAYCDTSKVETDWSGWLSFSFPHSAPPQGITQEPSLLDRFTHLMPNPAADKVTVTSELGLRRIEVYNARGILVYSEPAGYSATTIDLRGWPSGQYMMTIETPQGKTAKRLVVTR